MAALRTKGGSAMKRLILGVLLAGTLPACATLPNSDDPKGPVPILEGEKQIGRYMARLEREVKRREPATLGDDTIIVVTGSRVEAAPEITNNQEAGVDEGGIVKVSGDYLVVLRRGRLFSLRVAGDQLEAVSSIDAFPPGDSDPDDTWYDEMLVSGDTIVSIGYSYGEDGTEISRFRLLENGRFEYRDTHYRDSEDYYSSRNYASRMIGDTLLVYSPASLSFQDWKSDWPSLTRRLEDGSRQPVPLDGGRYRLAVPQRYLDIAHPEMNELHSVLRCNVQSEKFDCSQHGVLGGRSREFYITTNATYIWASGPNDWRTRDDNDEPDMLYRIEVDGEIFAVGAHGAPIDQFSYFEDKEEDRLFVVVEDGGWNGPMWTSEYVDGNLALLELDQDVFGDGSRLAASSSYRPLAAVEAYGVENRFVGRFLIYGGGHYGDEEDIPYAFVSPLDARWVQKIDIPHGVTRIDRMGNDSVIIGPGIDEQLGFSTLSLDDEKLTANLVETYMLPNAQEGENRSHAFFFQPDSGADQAHTGTLALPVTIGGDTEKTEFLGRASSIFFLRREDRDFRAAGHLQSATLAASVEDDDDGEYYADSVEEDSCVSSCTDWYGNARPIFLGDRIFALMGYELVEGRMVDGKIVERRRIDFSPKN